MSEQQVADALAERAVAEIRSGMIVGVGAGKTSARCVRALVDRVKNERLDIKCVAVSERSEALCIEHGLAIVDFALVEQIDYLFDGADEVDGDMNLLKGSGGAVTRERMLAWAAKKSVYVIAEKKLVHRLGTRHTLPIAIMVYGLSSIRAELRHFGLNGICRRSMDGKYFITDNANMIIDIALDKDEPRDLEELSGLLNSIPGVIDHGLFLSEADEVLIDRGDKIDRMVRATD